MHRGVRIKREAPGLIAHTHLQLMRAVQNRRIGFQSTERSREAHRRAVGGFGAASGSQRSARGNPEITPLPRVMRDSLANINAAALNAK
jgi:hypothetical protein